MSEWTGWEDDGGQWCVEQEKKEEYGKIEKYVGETDRPSGDARR